MRQRLISAAVLVPVVVGVFLLGQPWLTIGFGILAAGCAYEAARLVRLTGLRAYAWLAVTIAGLGVAGIPLVIRAARDTVAHDSIAAPNALSLVVFVVVGVVLVMVVAPALLALRERDARSGFQGWIGTLFATAYPLLLVSIPAALVMAPVRSIDRPQPPFLAHGESWLIFLVLTVWALDSFAYLAGRYHGRGRFMNHISPNKTWSGVVGGTLAAVVVAVVVTFAMGEPLLFGAALGLVVAIAAQAGDLAESMLKRAAGAKDSGNLLPGHGGLLDRVDSFLFAGPALFFVLAWSEMTRLIPTVIPV